MRIDKFTAKFQLALQDAQSLAVSRDHQFIEPLHLMTALLDQEGGSVRHLLVQSGANVNQLRTQLGSALEALPTIQGHEGDVHLSNDLGKLLNVTEKFAGERKDQFVSSEIFVVAAVDSKGKLGELLKAAGVTKDSLEKSIEQMRGGQQVNDPNAEDQRQALEKYTVDVTERAEQGKLDPVIGRDDEIRRTVQVLQRRTGVDW